MTAVKIESHSQLLEDGDDALLPEPKIEEGEEFVEIDKGEAQVVEPAAKKSAAAAPAKKVEASADDADLPADLKGKSQKELASMYRDAQSLIGRQGSELGEFRRKADMLIQASLANLAAGKKAAEPEKKPAEDEIDDSEFFANPKAAIAKAVAQHPLFKQIEATLGKDAALRERDRASKSTEKFNAAHPDSGEIMQDPEFRKWVGASKVRTALLRSAHSNFDFDAGDEIFGTWKALREVRKPDENVNVAATAVSGDVSAAAKTLAAARKKATLRDAAAPTGGGGSGAEPGSKKIYRRADVLRLMEEDSARYEALAPEIELAYREGRVR